MATPKKPVLKTGVKKSTATKKEPQARYRLLREERLSLGEESTRDGCRPRGV